MSPSTLVVPHPTIVRTGSREAVCAEAAQFPDEFGLTGEMGAVFHIDDRTSYVSDETGRILLAVQIRSYTQRQGIRWDPYGFYTIETLTVCMERTKDWGSTLIRRVRKALGWRGTRIPTLASGTATLGPLDHGMRVRLDASASRPGARRCTHRIHVQCHVCGRWIPAGRFYSQHVGTQTCREGTLCEGSVVS